MRESKRLKAITLLLQRSWKNSHKLVPCAERGKRKNHRKIKKLLPEKLVIFLPRVGGLAVQTVTSPKSLQSTPGFCWSAPAATPRPSQSRAVCPIKQEGLGFPPPSRATLCRGRALPICACVCFCVSLSLCVSGCVPVPRWVSLPVCEHVCEYISLPMCL